MEAISKFFAFVVERKDQILELLIQHIQLTFIAVAVSIACLLYTSPAVSPGAMSPMAVVSSSPLSSEIPPSQKGWKSSSLNGMASCWASAMASRP